MAFPLPHIPAVLNRSISRPFPRQRPLAALACAALVLAVGAAGGCRAGDDTDGDGAASGSGGGRRSGGGGRRGDPSALPIAPLPMPYRAAEVPGGGGGLEGVVEVDGELPRDTIVRPALDEAICGDQVVDTTIDADGGKLGDVVVWLDDVEAGKAIPLSRRFELTNERCRLTPRVQAAIAGGTLNVRSVDPVLHRTRFTGGPVGRPVTLAEIDQTDEGQVVPNEDVLRAPGLVEVRCETHPWSRAFVAVFDHPYFTITRHQGVFVMDSIPPGRHRLVAWHERFGRVEQTVEVKSGETVKVTVKLKGK